MRDKIKLESSAGTGHFYTTTKNKRTMPGKLEIKKPLVRYRMNLEHLLFTLSRNFVPLALLYMKTH